MRFTCRGVFLPSCVSHIQVGFKIQENTWDLTSDTGDTMRYLGLALPRPAAFQLFIRLEGVMGKTWWHRCMFRLKMKVPLGTLVKTSLILKIRAWFRNDSHQILPSGSRQSRIAVQNCYLGSSCTETQFGDSWSNAFNQRAGVRSDGATFGLGGWSRLIWPKPGRFVLLFFPMYQPIPLHFKVVRAQVDLKVAMTLGSSMAEIMAQLPQKHRILELWIAAETVL